MFVHVVVTLTRGETALLCPAYCSWRVFCEILRRSDEVQITNGEAFRWHATLKY